MIDENAYVKEIKSLCYVPAKWGPGLEPAEDEKMDADPPVQLLGRKHRATEPLVKAHFLGLQKDSKSKYPKKI